MRRLTAVLAAIAATLWACGSDSPSGGDAQPTRSIPAAYRTFADDFKPSKTLWVDASFNSSSLSAAGRPELFYGDTYVGDGTQAYPFASIHQAVSDTEVSATPGTQVNVKRGTYGDKGVAYWHEGGKYTRVRETSNSIIFRCSGAQGAPIMLYSVDGPAAAVIDGFSDGNDQGNGLMLIVYNNYIIIDGFEVKNCGQNIQVGGYFGHDIMIRNCHVHDAFHGDCIKVSQMDNVYIQNCRVHDPGIREDGVSRQEPIDYVAVNNGHMIFNEIYTCDFGMYAKGGSRNIVFYGNYVHDCKYTGIALGGFTGSDYFYNSRNDPSDDQYECYNCHAYNNVVANVGMAGIECIGCIDSTAEFNTLYDCARDYDEAVMVRPGSTSWYWTLTVGGTAECSVPKNFTFRNNVIANADGGMLYPFRNNDMGCGVRAAPADIHLSRNLWWSQGVTLQDGNPVNHIPVMGDANSVYNADPRLETGSLPYLRVQSGSPVIGKGVANPAVTLDFEGRARHSPPDLGAFEHR